MSRRIVLNSKDSVSIYKDNKSYNFIVHLPRQLSFSGNWTVSLLEFTYLGAKPSEPELYVYCNLCDNTIVGEREVPLLRRIYVANSINHIFEYPYEVPLKTVAFQDIQIYINDFKQELASFLSGEVTVTLQLKQRPF